MKTEEIKKRILKRNKKRALTDRDFVSTGSTMLNLACTDRPNRGFAKGHYYLLVGDTSSGKTFLSLTCLAEATINPNFKKHRLIYDNGEHGALMDIRRFFGKEVERRLRPPAKDKEGNPKYSEILEDFYYYMDDWTKRGHPFIYILDSIDSLTSNPEKDKFDQQKDARRRGKDAAGSYGDGKAKINSSHLRRFINPLRESGSILIIINQTRANLGGFGKTRSGGHALQFYACIEIWSSVKSPIEKTYKGKKRVQGTMCRIAVKKNRVTGKNRLIYIPIYNSYGIDDVGSCVDYLLSEKHWKKRKAKIKAPEFDFLGTKEKLIQHIVDNKMEKDLSEIAGDVWQDIENALAIKRKPRYD